MLETLVFGRLVGNAVHDYLSKPASLAKDSVDEEVFKMRERLQEMVLRKDGESVALIRKELHDTMDTNAGVFRVPDELQIAIDKITELRIRFASVSLGETEKKFNYALVRALELENMIDLADTIAQGALRRDESRGAHWRLDYPQRDDSKFLKHTLAYLSEAGMRIEYKDVNLGQFAVKERAY